MCTENELSRDEKEEHDDVAADNPVQNWEFSEQIILKPAVNCSHKKAGTKERKRECNKLSLTSDVPIQAVTLFVKAFERLQNFFDAFSFRKVVDDDEQRKKQLHGVLVLENIIQ